MLQASEALHKTEETKKIKIKVFSINIQEILK